MDWIGKTLGKVYIESLLARGGMAEVYLGTHTTLQRRVAVKLLRPYQTDDVRLRPLERFEMEARAVARLRHPNIVQVFDFDTIEDQPYLVMEYISGPSLSKYLGALHQRGDRLGLPLVDRLLTRIAAALQYAHESGVIHRDVKPGNILLTSRSIQIVPGETLPLDLEPVLTDFGLVRFLNSSRQTASGLITGTPAYMSPEQAMGQATDGRTDIYSLGIVLYEMLSGDVPFDAETTMSILLKHINEAPPPIRGLSPALQRVLDRALAKSPDERFQQPEEFAAAFTMALDERSDASTLVVPPLPIPPRKGKPGPRPQHNWMRIVLAGALALLLAVPLLSRGIFNAAQEEPTPSPSVSESLSDTPIFEIPVTLGPTGMLLFQDGNATLDQTSLIAYAMPAPPTGNHYRVWLANDEDRLTLGILDVDGSGKGELVFNDPQNANLLAMYHRVEVTIEGNNQAAAEGEEGIAYAYALPDQGLVYLRGLMAAFPALPEKTGLIQGLTANVESINEAAREMLVDFQSGDEAAVREKAESIASLLVGEQSPDYQDWDGDGQISDPGDGYGLLLNGNNLGYIQAVYSHADYAINSPGATRNMIVNGEDVKLCTQNLARWAPELRNHILTILDAGTLSEVEAAVRRSAELADQMLNGIDLDETGQVASASEECGVLLAYEQAYHMADMPLLPVAFNSLDTPVAITGTPTPIVTVGTPLIIRPTRETSDSGGSGSGATQTPPNEAPATSAPPADPPGNSDPKPTKEPKPTDKPKDNPGQPGGSDPPGNSGSSSNSRPTKKP